MNTCAKCRFYSTFLCYCHRMRMKNEDFVIRYYGKSELAMLYFPDDNKENALYKLRIELKLNPNLRHLVSKNARRYSPKDVKQITDELGDPY